MLLAQHALMQNEAIMALTILIRICPAESETLLIEADFGRNIRKFFETYVINSTISLDVHIILNALSLLDSVVMLPGILKLHIISNVFIFFQV